MILKNKTALITGAGGAIGGAIAKAFAKEGCRLILCGRSLSSLQKIKNEVSLLGSDAIIFETDVSDIESMQKLANSIKERFGTLDVLVTAAGIYGEVGPISQCDPAKWMDAVKVNLFGTFLCVKYMLPFLEKSSRGKIITFAGGGENPLPFFTSYACSKSAAIRFTQCVAKELEEMKIEINSISPGLVNSGLTKTIVQAGPLKVGKKKYEATLAELDGRKSTVAPDKAAALAVFLASSESDGLTGRNISAVWDNWKKIPKNIEAIKQSDIYTWHRIKPKERGYDW
ncbi:SDR family oxidoreductase [Patescibacteria group bacterium]|nr:SDR family oxidoreductase [Patescibacteria group bacterium]